MLVHLLVWGLVYPRLPSNSPLKFRILSLEIMILPQPPPVLRLQACTIMLVCRVLGIRARAGQVLCQLSYIAGNTGVFLCEERFPCLMVVVNDCFPVTAATGSQCGPQACLPAENWVLIKWYVLFGVAGRLGVTPAFVIPFCFSRSLFSLTCFFFPFAVTW